MASDSSSRLVPDLNRDINPNGPVISVRRYHHPAPSLQSIRKGVREGRPASSFIGPQLDARDYMCVEIKNGPFDPGNSRIVTFLLSSQGFRWNTALFLSNPVLEEVTPQIEQMLEPLHVRADIELSDNEGDDNASLYALIDSLSDRVNCREAGKDGDVGVRSENRLDGDSLLELLELGDADESSEKV